MILRYYSWLCMSMQIMNNIVSHENSLDLLEKVLTYFSVNSIASLRDFYKVTKNKIFLLVKFYPV